MRTPHDNLTTEGIQTIKQAQADKNRRLGKKLNPSLPKIFWSYPFMVAIMACLQVLCTIYGLRITYFFGFSIGIGRLVLLPIILYIFQVVSECYGWQYTRQIVWCNFVVNGITTFVCLIFSYVPFASVNHTDIIFSFQHLIDKMWVPSLTNWICVFLADYAASALMCESRFQFNGRFTMSRMIIIHCISEIILLSSNFISAPSYGYSMHEIYFFVWNGFIARTIMSLMLLPFARIVVWFIQHKIEGVVVFDYKRDFNPFKFKVDPNLSVQFSATGWDKIDSSKVDISKIAYDFYNDEFFDNLPGNPIKGYKSKKEDSSTDNKASPQNPEDKGDC